jgi:hypothetical protein
MPDSDVTRARRRRAHLRGDHRECGPKCVAKRTARAASVPACDTVTGAVEAFAAAVAGWPDTDPRRTELALCRMLAQRLDAGDADWRAGEYLTGMMRMLAVDVEHAADAIDEIRAEGAAAEIARLTRLAQGKPLPVQPAQHWANGRDA